VAYQAITTCGYIPFRLFIGILYSEDFAGFLLSSLRGFIYVVESVIRTSFDKSIVAAFQLELVIFNHF